MITLGGMTRREQTYWKPEVRVSPVAAVTTKSLQTRPQLSPVLVFVLFILSHLLSDLSCPSISASAALLTVKRAMRIIRMVRTGVIPNCRSVHFITPCWCINGHPALCTQRRHLFDHLVGRANKRSRSSAGPSATYLVVRIGLIGAV